ncbi:hypothetical protein CALVIDRAFT_564652 [Calocera viscosa TUFC12733]|uniref:Uncharacterized protein n=1 Tax=Calocera viscosa (strain TUFC12733) TaxID=1330018 RepID=A0A167LEI0_CALVF|nr:hypothetical protein CALVIDRAFT_564652 [Calocera viscosa TUFC12733]
MSSNTTNPYGTIGSLPNISGGIPTQPDFAPAIVFCILYGLLLPVCIWRTYTYRRPASLMWTFIRLTLFVAMRIATFGLRASEAHAASLPNNPVPNLGAFIGEQVLLGIGFIVLADLMIELLKSHIWRTDVPPAAETRWALPQGRFSLQRIVRLMHLALIVAIALGIAAAAQYSGAINNASTASQVQTLRVVSVALCLAVCGLLILVSLLLLVTHPHIGISRTIYLLVVSCILVIIPAYRLSSVTADPSLEALISTGTQVKFYVLQGAMEWLVSVSLLLVDARVWFFAGGERAQMMLGGNSGSSERYPQASANGEQLAMGQKNEGRYV